MSKFNFSNLAGLIIKNYIGRDICIYIITQIFYKKYFS